MQVTRKTLFGVATLAMAIGACGSSSDGDGGDGKEVIGNDFGLAFSPIYSASDNGAHEYQVPIVPQGGVVVDTWEITDKSGKVLSDVADFTKEASFGGAMLKTRKPGDYYVVAKAGKQVGCAQLHITAGTADQWNAGEARYNNSIMLSLMAPTEAAMAPPMVPKDVSCKNCHGEGAMFLAVEHTPQQTAGYTDDELGKILTMGMKPTPPDPGVQADCTPYPWMPSKTGVPLAIYRWFHTWQATPEEVTGLVLYLRSLAPKSQGPLDFGGLRGGATGAGAAGSGT